MQLKRFQVLNYRSINDSGPIDTSRLTALLGRNESGKSNLLRALASLNPPDGVEPLNKSKDFPRHRRLEECSDETVAVRTTWELSEDEKQSLAELWPRAASVSGVDISRTYDGTRFVGFAGLEPLRYDPAAIAAKTKKIVPAVQAQADKAAADHQAGLKQAADQFESAIAAGSDRSAWAAAAVTACAALRKALAAADRELTDAQEKHLLGLEELAAQITGDAEAQKTARQWVIKAMPVFIFLDEYPELEGHQNITQLLQRRSSGNLTDADKNFYKMCKVAGLDPEELQRLLSENEHETRNQLANRAGSVITAEIRRLWKDRRLKIRFDTDAEHVNTFVSDPNAAYDVEVNLDERSRGFRWFFSFYVTFAADTKGGDAKNAMLLLDEPGLYLHARSQRDLLHHLEGDFENQIIYTTHSPFMVPTHRLDSVRTVNIAEDVGTTVTNDPTGDSRTLFPLQAALGYDLAQSLFVGPHNLIVEGVTDFWALSSISEYLASSGGTALSRDITITPAGGAQKIHYLVALLTSEELNVLTLLDHEKDALSTRDDLVKSKLIAEKQVIFVSEAWENPPKEADIEDLLDTRVYEELVRESYAKELEGKDLKLNDKIPRIARRFEAAFKAAGLEFHKTRPMRLLLKKMGTSPEQIVLPDVVERFSRLNAQINDRMP